MNNNRSNDRFRDLHIIRDVQGADAVEIFLVMAVASILGIRFFLAMTGYPKLGGGGLHIAHVLVGGIFMLLSIVVLLNFLNKGARSLAAILGGFGFGAFIDELGKFVTSDNDYFFAPTVGLIYITFILLYFLVKKINSRRWLTPEERLINALEISKEAVLKNINVQEKQLALDLLAGSDPSPLIEPLKDIFEGVQRVPQVRPGFYQRQRERAREFYRDLVQKSWFNKVLIAFFISNALISLLISLNLTVGLSNALFWTGIAAVILWAYKSLRMKKSAARTILFSSLLLILIAAFLVSFLDVEPPVLPAADWLQIGFSVLAGLFVAAGVFSLRKNRYRAYDQFKNSILTYIFFVQVFTFFDEQFWGLFGLGMNILTLGAIRYMIDQETAKR